MSRVTPCYGVAVDHDLVCQRNVVVFFVSRAGALLAVRVTGPKIDCTRAIQRQGRRIVCIIDRNRNGSRHRRLQTIVRKVRKAVRRSLGPIMDVREGAVDIQVERTRVRRPVQQHGIRRGAEVIRQHVVGAEYRATLGDRPESDRSKARSVPQIMHVHMIVQRSLQHALFKKV